jgi:hypothetical protein
MMGIVLLAVFALELVQGFLLAGNEGAHYLGFVAGFLITRWYLQ